MDKNNYFALCNLNFSNSYTRRFSTSDCARYVYLFELRRPSIHFLDTSNFVLAGVWGVAKLLCGDAKFANFSALLASS